MGIQTKIGISPIAFENEITIVDACRQNDLKQSEVERWIKAFLDGGEQNLKSNAKERQEHHAKEELHNLRAQVGDLVLEVDAIKKLQALID